jgi:hypothetical protein
MAERLALFRARNNRNIPSFAPGNPSSPTRRGDHAATGLNGSNEMTLASSNSLHQGLDPLPT